MNKINSRNERLSPRDRSKRSRFVHAISKEFDSKTTIFLQMVTIFIYQD